MLSIDPQEIKVPQLHAYLLGCIGPRPIAFASTLDKEGRPNLAPFSFFNVFSSKPPILIFSPARSGRTGITKHTHDNVKERAEVVINVVNYDMVHQMSLASSPYEKGVDEFVKAGFTKLPSDIVKPYRVAESPAQFECKVNQVIELSEEGGAGNLIICEVVKLHIRKDLINELGQVDQKKIDLIARMGGNWYCRAHGDALFEVEKPLTSVGIGVDAIPDSIRNSHVLTGNHLGMLGNIEQLPTAQQISSYPIESFSSENEKHNYVAHLLNQGKVQEAWIVLLK